MLLKQTAMRSVRTFLTPFLAPTAAAALLFGLAWTPRVQANDRLMASFLIAAGVLLAWALLLAAWMWRKERSPDFIVVLRRQHYVQGVLQLSIYAYWGWYWSAVYGYAALLFAQIVFGFGFDTLLSWTRGRRAMFGLGVLPIILSTNVFIWFKDEWYVLQFVMIAIGYLGKALITWERDGRRTHIFNPSGFALSVASVILIATGTTDITWGVEIAETLFRPPHIYVLIFLLGVVVQSLFSVTMMTLAAIATVYLFGTAYSAVTGVFFFVDTGIPIAVFLGMFLLVTDPSTSPKTEMGRFVFGAAYGLSVLFFYALLDRFGVPNFYDKLLGIPLLNLSARGLDRWARGLDWERLRSVTVFESVKAHANAWEMSFLAGLFALMIGTGFVGDRHEGQPIVFWQKACGGGNAQACDVLERLQTNVCDIGSGWACNELGVRAAGAGDAKAGAFFERACSLGFEAGCSNRSLAGGQAAQRAAPEPEDWVLLLQEGKGPLPGMNAEELFSRACDRGWAIGCQQLGTLYVQGLGGDPPDVARAADALERGCALDDAPSCATLAIWYDRGQGVPADSARAVELMRRTCELGVLAACDATAP